MAHPDNTLNGTITLDGRLYKVSGAVEEELANVFAPPVRQGAVGPADHPFFSTFTQRNWEGGGGINKLADPDVHVDRYWWSTCDGSRPGALTLPPYTYSYSYSTTPVMVGDHIVSGTYRFYIGIGTDLQRWDSATDTFTSVATMGAPAYRHGVDYTLQSGANAGETWMFIPQNTAYDVLKTDGTTIATGAGSGGAIDFAVWDEKIFRLRSDGVVDWQTDGGATWVQVGAVTDGSKPRRLVLGWDRSGFAALFVVTNAGAYVLDYDAVKLRRLEVEYPRHPYQGLAAVQHDGLVVSVGMGTHRLQGDLVISDQGLDRAEGLPKEYRGHIVDFASSYGMLFALVQGAPIGGASTEGVQLDLGGGVDGLYFSENQSNALLMIWNGRGWSYRWDGAGATPTNVYVSNAQDAYRVFWGASKKAYSQKLSTTFFSPFDQDSTGEYAEECVFYTFRHNWGWLNIPKILKEIETYVSGSTATETVQVAAQIDSDTAPWTLLGTISADGETSFRFGLDAEGLWRGLEHKNVKLRFTLKRRTGAGNKQYHPVIEWFSLVARKWLRPIRSWGMVLDLTAKVNDYTPEANFAALQALAAPDPGTPKQAVQFTYNGNTATAEVSGLKSQFLPGKDAQHRFVTLRLLEAFEIA